MRKTGYRTWGVEGFLLQMALGMLFLLTETACASCTERRGRENAERQEEREFAGSEGERSFVIGEVDLKDSSEVCQVVFGKEDQEILFRFLDYACDKELDQKRGAQRIVETARFFLDTPYRGGTLEGGDREQLVVNLRELDCVTLVDNVLVLALLTDYSDRERATIAYLHNLQKIRYREGEIKNYTSRLHYSSDWLFEMGRQGILSDVTRECGGEPYVKNIDFISRNASLYPALQQAPELIETIREIEQAINGRSYYYIPKAKVKDCQEKIMEGDVILITTNRKGLDTAHLGIACREAGELRMIHASSDGKKVVFTSTSLADYLHRISSFSGVMIGRVLN